MPGGDKLRKSTMSDKATKKREKDARVAGLTKGLRSVMLYLFGISGIINILALTGAFYMMQVYDRALTSQSVPTLVALSLPALFSPPPPPGPLQPGGRGSQATASAPATAPRGAC